ncbi:hypothetical protein ABID13_002231 [Enterocloster citroniae]|uniref:Uncharacterized protein n=1 Tax=Enterocloster citroniae TaxID=358743 RepID=A0ABV2FX49_9FIRM
MQENRDALRAKMKFETRPGRDLENKTQGV